jgi:phosphoserine phosphatase
MTTGMILSLLSAGLALLLARENKLRRALQALRSRLMARLAEVSRNDALRPPAKPYFKTHSRRNRR